MMYKQWRYTGNRTEIQLITTVCIYILYIYKEVYNRMYQGKLHVAISRRDRTLKNDALGLGVIIPKWQQVSGQ